jgi:arylsulfatase A-like enzyme
MAERPNVLLVSTDHWPAELLGVAGHPDILTPTLDELARSGVRFRNAYAECPVCIPARRTLMTGVSPRTHGDRDFAETMPMPDLPTMAQTFRNGGYQAYAVGKLHVYPQRDRIGFDDVILDEEGRTQYGVVDDYEAFLSDRGFTGRQFDHAMSNNDYVVRPWHLSEEVHATNWAAQQMVRTIKRRDPVRPAFWFLSFRHPHPPIVPLETYLKMYRDAELRWPSQGSWCRSELPYLLQAVRGRSAHMGVRQIRDALQSFYALCTHIDHQLRVVIGTLREEGLLNNTAICFTSDHGDMLGRHGLWAKRLFYEGSANIPMILVGAHGDRRVGHHRVDDRLVGWQDVMPTLLDLAGIEAPGSVEGLSMLGDQRREWLYGEVGEGDHATRMIRKDRYKLIYYPAGNRRQLFDVEADPQELMDLSERTEYIPILEELDEILIRELYGGDESWASDGQLIGLPARSFRPGPNRGLSSQRGHHWPPPPKTNMKQIEWHNEEDP